MAEIRQVFQSFFRNLFPATEALNTLQIFLKRSPVVRVSVRMSDIKFSCSLFRLLRESIREAKKGVDAASGV